MFTAKTHHIPIGLQDSGHYNTIPALLNSLVVSHPQVTEQSLVNEFMEMLACKSKPYMTFDGVSLLSAFSKYVIFHHQRSN